MDEDTLDTIILQLVALGRASRNFARHLGLQQTEKELEWAFGDVLDMPPPWDIDDTEQDPDPEGPPGTPKSKLAEELIQSEMFNAPLITILEEHEERIDGLYDDIEPFMDRMGRRSDDER